MAESPDVQAVGDRIASLLDELRSSTEPRVWFKIEELVRLLTDLYGAGLARTIEIAGPGLLTQLARDELVASLLLLHGMHPDDLAGRAQQAVDAAAAAVRARGAEVRLVAVEPESGTVRVAVTASGTGCGSAAGDLRDFVQQSISEAVADASIVEVALFAEERPAETFVRLGRKNAPAGAGT